MENGENSYKPCTQCKRLTVPFYDARKSCESCRAKARERNRAKKHALAIQLAHLPPPPAEQSQSQHRKRKAKEILNTNVGAPKELTSVTPGKSTILQYQKASSLYDAIKVATSSSPSCTFAGCHSIIQCDNIDHIKREQMVAKDLRKIVKIPFTYTKPLKSIIRDTKVRVKYNCTCSLSPPKTLTSTKSLSLLRDSDVTACGGMVIITVRDDGSHPLGIPGQQIIVQIVH